MRWIPALTLVAACRPPGELGGGETEWELEGAADADTDADGDSSDELGDLEVDGLTSSGVTASGGEPGGDTGDDGTTLELSCGSNTIDVNHFNLRSHCGTIWTVTPEFLDDSTIVVTYGDDAERDDGTRCTWELGYTISNVPSGEWTVVAGTQQEACTVD